MSNINVEFTIKDLYAGRRNFKLIGIMRRYDLTIRILFWRSGNGSSFDLQYRSKSIALLNAMRRGCLDKCDNNF